MAVFPAFLHTKSRPSDFSVSLLPMHIMYNYSFIKERLFTPLSFPRPLGDFKIPPIRPFCQYHISGNLARF